jgi:hypothetical protein
MRREWSAPWRWGVGVLAAVVLVILTGCGNSGSISRGASGLTGSTTVSEEVQDSGVEKKKENDKGKGKGKDKDKGDKDDDRGEHRGRPYAEVEGAVTDMAGRCPVLTFKVAGAPVRATGVTRYHDTTCRDLADGTVLAVKVEGQPLGNGTILARKVEMRESAPPRNGAEGLTLSLLTADGEGPHVVTGKDGKFEFRDTKPGVYHLVASIGDVTCATPLASDLDLVARRNRVRGKLTSFNGAVTCDTLEIQRLEVRQGNQA